MGKERSEVWVLMNDEQTEPYRVLDVEVVRCLLEPHRDRWRVLEQGRRLAGTSPTPRPRLKHHARAMPPLVRYAGPVA